MSQTWNDGKLIQLANEMKEAGKSRREVSLAVCKLMFYEMNIQPASSSVYKITRFGSMTDIQADIRYFWNQLRDASQVTVNVAGVPDEVTALFSSQMLSMWEIAMNKATRTYEQERAEMLVQLEHTKIRNAELNEQCETAETTIKLLEQAKVRLENELNQQSIDFNNTRSTLEAENASLREAVSDLKMIVVQKDDAIAQINSDHAAQLQSELDRHARDQEYLDGQWKASMMQVEEARQSIDKMRSDRDAVKIESLERERQLNHKIAYLENRLSKCQQDLERSRTESAVAIAQRDLLAKQLQYRNDEKNPIPS